MLKRNPIPLLTALTLLMVSACQKLESLDIVTTHSLTEAPVGFPPILFPKDNSFTVARWELGKKLFYDNILSLDQSISCSSCHKASLAFSDEVKFSDGIMQRAGVRNSPTLANVAYHPYFTREGGISTLEKQVLVPLQEHNEFGFNILLAGERLNRDSLYKQMSRNAYGREPDYFVITRALATFERTLVSGNSRYDQYHYQGDPMALNPEEKAGMNLFFSKKTNCSGCHSGFNFTNYGFENNGLYLQYKDSGRMRLTGLEDDRAKFKVPTLRNIEKTAPYMHDGSFETIEAVIDHYNKGGMKHQNQNSLIRPLGLTNIEKQQLASFLRSLTDETFINQAKFKNN